MSNGHVWWKAQERLRQKMPRQQFETWLRGTRLQMGEDDQAILYVQTTFGKELLDRYRKEIEGEIAAVAGKPYSLLILVEPLPASASDARAAIGATPRVPASSLTSSSRRTAPRARGQFDMPMLFGNSGSEAQVARAEALPATHRGDSEREAAAPRPGRLRSAFERARGAAMARDEALIGQRRRRWDAPDVPRQSSRVQAAQRGADVDSLTYDANTIEQRGVGQRQSFDTVDGNATMGQFGEMSAAGDEDAGRDEQERTPEDPQAAAEASEAARPAADVAMPVNFSAPIAPPKLNARYTFSTFIVGGGNRLAHAASQAVAEAPGQAYNPLFLYGGVGLGKTHLLHAVGHTAIQRGLTVLYVSSETFTNEIINAIRYRTTEEFRAKYRSADVLLVDDIQFIAGKESTEEEFFHTFNSLYETNKQIVICSDRPPKAMMSLQDRLRSRFEWGLVADIQPPDLETRVAILRAKADLMQRQIPDDLITFLASRVQSNIRELEGSLNRLLAYSQLQGMPLTLETAKAALVTIGTDSREPHVSIDDVLEVVADYYRMSPNDLRGKQRDKHIVVPRQIAMYLMRQETEASLLEIGQALGGRDHSTVLHGCEKISREVNENAALRKEVLAIRQQLLG